LIGKNMASEKSDVRGACRNRSMIDDPL